MEIYPIIGLGILVSSFGTQLIKILWTKETAGISPWALAQLLVCCLLFAGYYLGNGHFIALVLNLLLMGLVISILVLYRKHGKQLRSDITTSKLILPAIQKYLMADLEYMTTFRCQVRSGFCGFGAICNSCWARCFANRWLKKLQALGIPYKRDKCVPEIDE